MNLSRKGPTKVKAAVRAQVLEHLTPKSSNVIGGTYYPEHSLLRVRFKRSGGLLAVYEYQPVTVTEWEAFKAAESAGKYVGRYLKPKIARQVA